LSLPRIHPMRLRLVKQPFDHPDYIFELKMDGFRAIAYLQNGQCKLVSRNLNNLRFQSLRDALAKLPVQNAILDGEIVCVDKNGASQFYQLLSGKGESIFYAFDLLWLAGEDLRIQPLVQRKERLARLVRWSGCKRLVYAQHIDRDGKGLFAEICSRDLEGIVAKRRLSIYKDDGTGWMKVKNPTYSQAEGRQELFERGK
jgi:bifunctional non-homologous end joining protein LigD